MNRKWIIPVVVATSIGLTGCGAGDAEKNMQAQSEAVQMQKETDIQSKKPVDEYKVSKPVVVELMTEELSEDKVYEWKVTTPKFNGHDNLTKIIGEDIEGTKEELQYIKDVEKGEVRSSPYSFGAEPAVYTNENGILGVKVDYYSYTGGAHGGYWTTYYNYDIVKKEIIELKSLFKEESDYLEILYSFLFNEMKDDQYQGDSLRSYYYEDKKELQYFIAENQINIFFDVYAIASYAAGQITYEVPVEAIESHLSDYGKKILGVE